MPAVIINQYGPIAIARCYFTKPALLPRSDILHIRHVSRPMEGKMWRNLPAQTLHIHLQQNESVLWEQVHEGTRYKIRRAENKDGFEITFYSNPSDGQLQEFLHSYNSFAGRKGLPRVSQRSLTELRNQRALNVSSARDKDGPLVFHQHIVADGRARLGLSCRLPNRDEPGYIAKLGRANRMLHWHDIKGFRQQGLNHYDFGGICLDPKRPDLNTIAQFKLGFGGELVNEFKCRAALTAKGRAVELWVNFRGWLRKRRESISTAGNGNLRPVSVHGQETEA